VFPNSLLAANLVYIKGKIVYGQETRNPSHHVAIKLIVTDSEEHRILKFLESQGMEVLEENCLIPVLEILLNGPVAFVVMPRLVNIVYFSYPSANVKPRWGGIIFRPLGCPIRNVIRIMHSLLKVSATPHPSVAFF
jgi:hypothetical protein